MFAGLRSSPLGLRTGTLAIILVTINLLNCCLTARLFFDDLYLNNDERYQCGASQRKFTRSSAYITGGDDVQWGEFPSVVMVDVEGALCSGVIYRSDVVLTASHCFDPDTRQEILVTRHMKVKVIVGKIDLEDGSQGREYDVGYVIRGDGVGPKDLTPEDPDFARLILKRHIRYYELAQPACVLRDISKYESMMGSDCHIVGFGLKQYRALPNGTTDPAVKPIRPGRVQKLEVQPIDCGPKLHPAEVCYKPSWKLRPRMDRGTCAGDSGAPILCGDSYRRWVVVATHVGGTNEYKPGVGSIDRGCVLGQESRDKLNLPDVSVSLYNMSAYMESGLAEARIKISLSFIYSLESPRRF